MHQSKPKFSIVLPTFNRSQSLARSITSVLRQSLDDFELLVVDDGSTEDIAEVCSSFSDARIIHLRQARRQGACAARNAGIHAARADWIAFQDSDDEWLPGKLEAERDVLERLPHIMFTYCGYRVKSCGGSTPGPASPWAISERNLFGNLLHGNFISTQTLSVRKHLLNTVGGFDERLPRLQDWDLVLRLEEKAEGHFIPESYVLIWQSEPTGGRISDRPDLFVPAAGMILDKHAKAFAALPSARSNLHLEIAKANLALGLHKHAFQSLILSSRIHFQLRQIIWGMLIAAGPWSMKCINILRNLRATVFRLTSLPAAESPKETLQ